MDNIFVTVDRYAELAKLFRFQGDTITKLCQYNSKVAKEQGLDDQALSWESLSQLYKEYISNRQNILLNDNKQRNVSGSKYNYSKSQTLQEPKMVKVPTKDTDGANPSQNMLDYKMELKKTPNLKVKRPLIRFIQPQEDFHIHSNFDIDIEEEIVETPPPKIEESQDRCYIKRDPKVKRKKEIVLKPKKINI